MKPDIERDCPEPDHSLNQLLDISTRIFGQKRNDKNKVDSVHAPEVYGISKGKAHKRCEFGCKVGVAATSRGGWFLGAMAVCNNPYDGHTLSDALEHVERIANRPEHVFADMGYRGHGYEGDVDIHMALDVTKGRHRARMNFAKLLKWAAAILGLIFDWLFGCQIAISVPFIN